jgi:plasmid stabilization system protein ParE
MITKTVILRRTAQESIMRLYNYLVDIGYPYTAKRYIFQMQTFILSLGNFPAKYPLCRYPLFKKEKLHCAIFKKHWIKPYEITDNEVTVRNVIHSSHLNF